MEEWRENLFARAKSNYNGKLISAKRSYETTLKRLEQAMLLRQKIIEQLRTDTLWISDGDSLYIKANNNSIAHDVVRATGVTLTKKAQSDGLNYTGEKDGVTICVFGKSSPPGCVLVRRTRIIPEHEEAYYELDCNPKKEEQVEVTK